MRDLFDWSKKAKYPRNGGISLMEKISQGGGSSVSSKEEKKAKSEKHYLHADHVYLNV
jgi:hypothetical protein